MPWKSKTDQRLLVLFRVLDNYTKNDKRKIEFNDESKLQEDMVCLSCTATGERVCLAAEGFGNRHCFLENIADKVEFLINSIIVFRYDCRQS